MAKILIVDDSQAQLYSIQNILEGAGYEVITAENGEDGLEQAQNERPDLILLDVVMPGMNGFQVLRRLTRDQATKNIPVIYVTTKNQETDRIWGMRQGAKAYLSKPVDRSELINAVGEVLAG